MAKKSFFSPASNPENLEREQAIKEYRAALRDLQGTSKRLDYELELQGLPKASSPSWRFAGMTTEEIRQEAEDFKRMRKGEIREELERTRGERSGSGAKDNVAALMESVSPENRDRLRDMIEENYELMDTAADLLDEFGEVYLEQWIDSYGDDELIRELWEDEDFDPIF